VAERKQKTVDANTTRKVKISKHNCRSSTELIISALQCYQWAHNRENHTKVTTAGGLNKAVHVYLKAIEVTYHFGLPEAR